MHDCDHHSSFWNFISCDQYLNYSIDAGQQQHYFDSRMTYHASRSAGLGMGAAGYPLTNTWGYQASYPASAYLGYNTGLSGNNNFLEGFSATQN